jgi:sortase A
MVLKGAGVGPRPSAVRKMIRNTRTAVSSGRLKSAAAALLLIVGLLLIAECVVTLAWQEPFSALATRKEQDALSKRLHRIESEALSHAGSVAGTRRDRNISIALRYRKRAARGDPLGRIKIPKLGMNFVFVSGVSANELSKGPGHYRTTALPGEHGTVGIAGHRTTHAAPFRHIDALRAGDSILLRMPYGRFRYHVEGSTSVSPTNTTSLGRVRHDRVALTSCDPPFSDAKRLVVTARLRSARFFASAGSEPRRH